MKISISREAYDGARSVIEKFCGGTEFTGGLDKEVEYRSIFAVNFQKAMNDIDVADDESAEILNNFIQKENNLTSMNVKNINMNVNYEINIKDIKYNLANINEKIYTYFKRPYMRKNIKKSKNIFDIKNIFDEDEKIKIKEKNFEDLKDDDTKTNNESFEDEYNLLDKKKFK